MKKRQVNQWWELNQALKKKQPFEFGPDMIELQFPGELLRKSVFSALKKSDCPVRRISFINRPKDSKKIAQLVDSIRVNKSIRSIILLEAGSGDADLFCQEIMDVIRAMKRIRTISLLFIGQGCDITKLKRFFEFLKQIKYIRLKLGQCSFSTQVLFDYINTTKYRPILDLESMDDSMLDPFLQYLTKTGNSNLDLIISKRYLDAENWKKILNISNIKSISIRDCNMTSALWKEVADSVTSSQTVKGLNFNLEDIQLDIFTHLVRHKSSLVRFGAKPVRDHWCVIENFAGFAETIKTNTTITYLDIRDTSFYYHYNYIADIVSTNKTLRTLRMDLDVAFMKSDEDKFKHFWKFIDALKHNTTLTTFKYSQTRHIESYNSEKERDSDPFKVDLLKAFAEVLKFNRTLLYVSDMERNENLRRNRLEHDRVKWNCIWFVHMIKRNEQLLDLLPLEIWVKVVAYFNLPELLPVIA